MSTHRTALGVAGLMLAGFAIASAPEPAEAQYYSYYATAPVYVSPRPVFVTPAPVYVAPAPTYYAYPSYRSYGYPSWRSSRYYPSCHKRYYSRPYRGHRPRSVHFSFGYGR